MKTEDWLAYEREREIVIRAFAHAPIELVLPLEVERAWMTAPWTEPNALSRGGMAAASDYRDPGLEV